ncbi:xylulokinase [Dactylosporangium cerinum]|uniref:Xylulose kinase n=1 Tax=Dactylosporangium cerinum TaxID=1434730 RepID=A0ABV9WFI2_9ACTN
MTLVAGVDSSTQSTKVVVCDADSGEVLREGRAPHPDGTEVDPELWWAAFERAGEGLLDGVAAIGVGGQQQGMICLDEAGEVVRPALLWNDTRSARAAADLTGEFGGPRAWADAVGLVPVASFTVTKLRWFARAEPELAARTAAVLLPHDWLTHRLRAGGGAPTTDRGEASGTGYWSPAAGEYRRDLVRLAFGRDLALPRVAGPAEVVGETASGALLSAGTGDTMGAALGVGLRPGDVAVSLGTSGCAFGLSDVPTADASGLVAGYADATGRFLPLVCTLNAARVLGTVADLLGRSPAGFDELALSAPPGAGGLTLLPYLDGERTPNLPGARGLLAGLSRANASAANLARAAVEGMLGGLADALDALRAQGVPVERVLLIGGAARSRAVQAIAPALFGAPVSVPSPVEYVALGAARQAAWALSGGAEPPQWPVAAEEVTTASTPQVHERYADVRQRALELMT